MSKPLPISLDVQVQLSLAQQMQATNMTLLCVCSPNVDFLAGDRVRVYSDFASFAEEVDSGLSLYWAGQAFFSQPLAPPTLAVARVFTASQPALVTSGEIDVTALTAIEDGQLTIQAGTTPTTLSGLDFSDCSDLADVVAVLGTGWSVNTAGDRIVFTSEGTGDDQVAAYATNPVTTGENATALLALTAATGAVLTQGYTFTDFATEIENIASEAKSAGFPIYGWALDAGYRDGGEGSEQDILAAYALASDIQSAQTAWLCSNDVTAYAGQTDTDLGSRILATGNSATFVAWHDNAQFYPEVSAAAVALGVNYALSNSTLTLKFKDLPGIDTVDITETQLAVLEAKHYNVLTLIANGMRTLRNGVQAAASWFTDTKVNLDNFVNELQTAIFNVFLQQPKVPYTVAGQMLLVAAAQDICERYKVNGTFADRQIQDVQAQGGYYVASAYRVEPMPIQSASASDRAGRVAPPIRITAYLAGAIHSVSVNVTVTQ